MIASFINEYRWLSNFVPVVVTLTHDGITYPSVEADLQGQSCPHGRIYRPACT